MTVAVGDRKPGGRVARSVETTLAGLPDAVAQSPTAMAALELAESIDQGPETYRFQASLVRELRECVADLVSTATALRPMEDEVDDLTARRDARRSGAARGVDAG